jgi:hypothetical protein
MIQAQHRNEPDTGLSFKFAPTQLGYSSSPGARHTCEVGWITRLDRKIQLEAA